MQPVVVMVCADTYPRLTATPEGQAIAPEALSPPYVAITIGGSENVTPNVTGILIADDAVAITPAHPDTV